MSVFARIILIFATFVFVLGAGQGVAFASASTEKKEEEHGAGGGMFSSGPEAFYVRMAPMILPVVGDRGVQEVVSLMVALEVEDQRAVEKVNGQLPRLNDAYMRALYGTLDRSVYRNGKFIDVTKVKAKLTYVTDMTLGHGTVRNVLIQGVNQRHFQ